MYETYSGAPTFQTSPRRRATLGIIPRWLKYPILICGRRKMDGGGGEEEWVRGEVVRNHNKAAFFFFFFVLFTITC